MDASSQGPPEFSWRAGVPLERLRHRASLLAQTRAFFSARGLLEVDTPQLVNYAVTDRHLHSGQVHWPGAPRGAQYLHTSPEYAMKRLLASGSGDVYQICHVFRGEEQGPIHNSEFTMLEWYREGWSLAELMQEVDDLLRVLLAQKAGAATRYLSYEEAFIQFLGRNPLTDPDRLLAECAREQGSDDRLVSECGRDDLLDLLMGAHIGPQLGMAGPVFVHHYPASQAALARLEPADRRLAMRFELYLHGIELANGFEELADADEQAARFQADQQARAARGLAVPPMDQFLLAALRAGLPACAGVALGFDRTLMIACGAERIDQVIAFTSDRA